MTRAPEALDDGTSVAESADLGWWVDLLAGMPELVALPADRARPVRPSGERTSVTGSVPASTDEISRLRAAGAGGSDGRGGRCDRHRVRATDHPAGSSRTRRRTDLGVGRPRHRWATGAGSESPASRPGPAGPSHGSHHRLQPRTGGPAGVGRRCRLRFQPPRPGAAHRPEPWVVRPDLGYQCRPVRCDDSWHPGRPSGRTPGGRRSPSRDSRRRSRADETGGERAAPGVGGRWSTTCQMVRPDAGVGVSIDGSRPPGGGRRARQ